MTKQFRECASCGSRNVVQADHCRECGQLLPPPEKRRTFTRRKVLIAGSACVVGLLGIGAGAAVYAQYAIAQANSPEVPHAVNGLAWSPDGKSIASYSDAGNVQIWEATGGKLKHTFVGTAFARNGGITQLVWSPDSSMLALGTNNLNYNGGTENSANDGSIRILNPNTGELQRSLRLALLDNTTGASSNYVAWSPDGQYIAAGDASMSGNIGMWSIKDWSSVPLKQLPGQYAEARGLGWSPDSQKLLLIFDALGNRNVLGTALVWGMQTKRAELTIQVGVGDTDGPKLDAGKGIELNLGGVAWSPDGKMFAVGLNQQALVFSSEGQLRFKHGVFASYGMAPTIAWSPTNPQRLAGQFFPDPTIYVWNPSTNQLIQKHTHAAVTTGVTLSWSPDGKYIASTDGNTIDVWPAE